jgi:hypothetical protein
MNVFILFHSFRDRGKIKHIDTFQFKLVLCISNKLDMLKSI